jgi:hypothetical protein
MKFFLCGFCGLHRPSNPYKLYNISVQILSILQICAKILLIHVQESSDMQNQDSSLLRQPLYLHWSRNQNTILYIRFLTACPRRC